MELTTEYYSNSYVPKLSDDKYAYYVDKSNYDIVLELVKKHIKTLKANGSYRVDDNLVEMELDIYNEFKIDMPFIIYFENNDIQYDSDMFFNYAENHDYTIIEIQNQQVMTFE